MVITTDIRLIVGNHSTHMESVELHNPNQLAKSTAVKVLQILFVHELSKLVEVKGQVLWSVFGQSMFGSY